MSEEREGVERASRTYANLAELSQVCSERVLSDDPDFPVVVEPFIDRIGEDDAQDVVLTAYGLGNEIMTALRNGHGS